MPADSTLQNQDMHKHKLLHIAIIVYTGLHQKQPQLQGTESTSQYIQTSHSNISLGMHFTWHQNSVYANTHNTVHMTLKHSVHMTPKHSVYKHPQHSSHDTKPQCSHDTKTQCIQTPTTQFTWHQNTNTHNTLHMTPNTVCTNTHNTVHTTAYTNTQHTGANCSHLRDDGDGFPQVMKTQLQDVDAVNGQVTGGLHQTKQTGDEGTFTCPCASHNAHLRITPPLQQTGHSIVI